MDIIYVPFVIAIIGVAGYFWYRSNPLSQFNIAKSLANSGKFDEAAPIFEALLNKHPEAPCKFAECKYRQGIEYLAFDRNIARTFFNHVLEIKRYLVKRSNHEHFETIEAKTYLEISKLNYSTILVERPSPNKINHILENIQYMDDAVQAGEKNEFNKLKQAHFDSLADLYYFFGEQNEKKENLVDAIQCYTKALDYANLADTSDNSDIIINANARIGICKLKNKEMVEETMLEKIDKAPDDVKTDFYFRYTKRLIKGNKFSDAEKLIEEKLNVHSPVIEKLKEIIQLRKNEDVIPIINQVNQVLENLSNNKFTIKELKDYYENLDLQIEKIKIGSPVAAEKLEQLKPTLFNRLLTHYITEKNFANAINLIQKYPSFWENSELLKNMSICCYGYANQGHLNTKNYKIIIAFYLTAVFSDEIMLKSLEQTSWNENYTFTLAEAIGAKHKYYHGTLPENVNYDSASETNISIGATQKELLNQFELLLIQKLNNNPSLSNIVQDFYTSEKESIERVVKIIDRDVLFISPYFAKTYVLNEALLSELNEIYVKNKNEEALEAGVPYLTPQSNYTVIIEYAQVKELVNGVEEAMRNNDLSELRVINLDKKRKMLINKYNRIASKIEDTLFNILSSKIDDNAQSEHLILLMEEAILFSNKNDKLKYQYSNYILKNCINKVNSGKMDRQKALALMKNAYFYSPDNPEICSNIITFIKFNLMDIINNQTKKAMEIYGLLDEIYFNRSAVFKQESVELENARMGVLRKLQKSGIDISLFDDDTLSLNKRQNLNEQGEKVKEALSYFKKMAQRN